MFESSPNTSIRSGAMDTSRDAGLRSYMLGVYNYMMLALAITGLTAFGVSQSPDLLNMIYGTGWKWVFMFAPLGVVFFLSARIMKMSVAAARAWFFGFSVLMGMSLASIFLIYTKMSIAQTFFITSASFGALSLWGYTTKRDLTGWGSFLFMGVIGLILVSIVNIFLKSPFMSYLISGVGVLLFAALTAYDTQKIKHSYYEVAGNVEMAARMSVMGALQLYLDFINLFLFLLRFLGNSND